MAPLASLDPFLGPRNAYKHASPGETARDRTHIPYLFHSRGVVAFHGAGIPGSFSQIWAPQACPTKLLPAGKTLQPKILLDFPKIHMVHCAERLSPDRYPLVTVSRML